MSGYSGRGFPCGAGTATPRAVDDPALALRVAMTGWAAGEGEVFGTIFSSGLARGVIGAFSSAITVLAGAVAAGAASMTKSTSMPGSSGFSGSGREGCQLTASRTTARWSPAERATKPQNQSNVRRPEGVLRRSQARVVVMGFLGKEDHYVMRLGLILKEYYCDWVSISCIHLAS